MTTRKTGIRLPYRSDVELEAVFHREDAALTEADIDRLLGPLPVESE